MLLPHDATPRSVPAHLVCVTRHAQTGLVLLGVLALSITPGVILYHQHVTGAAGGDGFVKSLIYQVCLTREPRAVCRHAS